MKLRAYVIAAIVAELLSGCRKSCKELVEVVSVGGCNMSGACGVKFSDGSFDTRGFPVVGQGYFKEISCR